MKTALLTTWLLVAILFEAAANGGDEKKADKQIFEVGHVYRFKNGEKAIYLGKDAEGNHQFQGYECRVKMKKVRRAPFFDSKKRRTTKRAFFLAKV